MRSSIYVITLLAATVSGHAVAAAQSQNGAGGAAQAAPATAGVDESAAEIVVTAERRGQDIQKTPISVVSLSGQELAKRGIADINTLQDQVPSLSYTDNGNTKFFNIRGVGVSESAPNQTVGVAVHWDGTYVAREFVFGDAFFDVASVEVLRGPQGTYTGQNASGGALYVNSVHPDFDGPSGFAEATIGNFGRKQIGSGVTFQLSDTIAARISGEFERRNSSYSNAGADGIRTAVDDRTQPGNLSRFLGRAQIMFKPSDDLDLLLIHQVSDRNSDGTTFKRFDTTGPRRQLQYDTQTQLNISYNRSTGILNYRGIDAFSVRVSGTYQTTKQLVVTDDDLTPAPGSSIIAIRDKYWTGELNLLSPDNQPFQWTVGATALNYRQPAQLQLAVPFLQLTARRRNEAVFGEIGYKLDTVSFKLGGRYNWDHAGFADGGFLRLPNGFVIPFTPGILDFKEFTGRAVADWQITPRHFVYATVSKGYKPGGTTPASIQYDSERVINYEAGWKGNFLNRMLTTSISAFYMDYQNYQTTFTPDINNPTSAITRNVDGTKIKGVEGQFDVNVSGVHFDGSFSVLDAKYGSLVVVQPAGLFGPGNPATATNINLNGRTIPYAAKFSGALGLSYDADLGNGTLTPSIRVNRVGAQWVNFFQADYNRIPARTLVNARIGYVSDAKWSAAIYANNLLDKDYIANVIQATDGVGAYTLGQPREVGLTLGYRF